MRVKLDERFWNLKYVVKVDKQNNRGHIDHPDTKNRRILIKEGQDPLDELATLLHEFLHAIDWNKDEEWIDARSYELAKILLRLGYEK